MKTIQNPPKIIDKRKNYKKIELNSCPFCKHVIVDWGYICSLNDWRCIVSEIGVCDLFDPLLPNQKSLSLFQRLKEWWKKQ